MSGKNNSKAKSSRAPRQGPPPREDEPGERLQKVLAAAGVGSRRECEQLIVDGRVEVDRDVICQLGTRVVPSQEIRVDGATLQHSRRVCYALNKPTGVVCTNHDPSGRLRVIDLIQSDQRLFPIGRLDRSSEGLILVTNDGELANLLTHPRYGVEKVYRVRVTGQPTTELLRKLEQGIHLADGFARVTSVRIKRRYRESTELEVVLSEGKNREIRRLLAKIGHKVLQLKRTAVGPIRLSDMPAGAYRTLTPAEVKRLRSAVGRGGSRTTSKRSKPRKPLAAAAVREREAPRSGGTVLDYDRRPSKKTTKKRAKSARKGKGRR